ncbi:uncharacterized protein LOC142542554 isoform X2 [Primulina tabacum]|uniref:uncharacterized protein LOC142542554 isoform X2 n=1 Tax=Primulina tabacum TaxID=48773 RepID=UPI003F5A0D36
MLAMAAAAEDYGISPPLQLHMVSAFLAMEPPDVVISLARDFGGGCLDDRVQSCIWRQCICKADVKLQGPYLKRFLKKLILEIESDGEDVLDELYERYAFYLTSLQDNDVDKGNSRILKSFSFLFSDESSGLVSCPKSRNLEVQLQCSLNLLEGDTGCSLWPSSIFMSEFVLSFPEIFVNKCCFEVTYVLYICYSLYQLCLCFKSLRMYFRSVTPFTSCVFVLNLTQKHQEPLSPSLSCCNSDFLRQQVGSGVGLVGICIAHVKASKVILSDGDLSALANMKVQCVCLPWESASKEDLCSFSPDIILGSDVIYNPSCLPHLVRVLATLLRPDSSLHNERRFNHSLQEKVTSNGSPASEILGHPSANGPVAFFTSVIRNIKTFDYFLALAAKADLIVMDITEKVEIFEFLPYLSSYPRLNVRIFKIYFQVISSNSLV